MRKLLFSVILGLSLVSSAGEYSFPTTAQQWFVLARHSKFSVHQQQQAIMAAIMLKMEELAPKLGLGCDVNGAYYWQYRDKPHHGQFWTNQWERESDSKLDLANRTCLEYIYRELDRFVKEANTSQTSYTQYKSTTNEEADWMK